MAQATAEAVQDELKARTGLFPRSVASVGETIFNYEDRATRIWLFSSIFWLTFVDLVGMTMAIELVTPNLYSGVPWLLFSRIRPIHVNGVIFAWLSSMYFGGIFYILPRLCGVRRLWSERLGYWTAWAWNGMFALGAVSLALGYTQGREYAEFIWPIDVLLVGIFMLNIVNIVMTVQNRRIRPLYVSVWWFLASPLWLAADYIIFNVMWRPGNLLGNGVPGASLSGALPDPLADGMLNWWGSHNLFGLWLTPMLIALTYYLVPRITNTPLYSHTLSLVSFWGIAFFYTGVGHHHLLQAPIPGWLKTFATFNSIMLLIPVFAFVSNIWLTMRGNWDKFVTNLPLRFTLTGFIFYFLVNVQGSFMAVPAFNRVIHFTNFIVAHAHLALLGAFTILGMGLIDYIVPQLYRRPIYSQSLVEWQYWLVTIGFLIFFWSLTFAGFLQGQNWLNGIPEINVLPEIRPHYIARAVGGSMILTSGIVQIINIWLTVRTDTSTRARRQLEPFIQAGEPAQAEA
ncbi:MAG: cbb3-type cytochrome c oxidase subunit I [Verrucomicrobiota bacterium]|nr:cbb3-type cytochrome c oxidase subunit I [Verrucomicrobiota bacterium]